MGNLSSCALKTETDLLLCTDNKFVSKIELLLTYRLTSYFILLSVTVLDLPWPSGCLALLLASEWSGLDLGLRVIWPWSRPQSDLALIPALVLALSCNIVSCNMLLVHTLHVYMSGCRYHYYGRGMSQTPAMTASKLIRNLKQSTWHYSWWLVSLMRYFTDALFHWCIISLMRYFYCTWTVSVYWACECQQQATIVELWWLVHWHTWWLGCCVDVWTIVTSANVIHQSGSTVLCNKRLFKRVFVSKNWCNILTIH